MVIRRAIDSFVHGMSFSLVYLSRVTSICLGEVIALIVVLARVFVVKALFWFWLQKCNIITHQLEVMTFVWSQEKIWDRLSGF